MGTVAILIEVIAFHIGVDCHPIQIRKAFFAYIAVPAQGISAFQGSVHYADQFVERKVVHLAMLPVVGDFYFERLVIRLVREAGQGNVVICIDTEAFGKALGRVFLAFIGEGFGHLAEIDVEEAVGKLLVLLAVLFLLYGFGGDGFHVSGKLRMIVYGRIVIDAGIGFFGNDAYLVECRYPAGGDASLGYVSLAVAQEVVRHLVQVFLAYDEHFREVVFAFSLAQ